MIRLTGRSKWVVGIASFIMMPIIAVTLGVGGGSASAQVVDYNSAVSSIDAACNTGLAMAHAGYGQNPSLNDATGVVTYEFVVLYKRCNGSSVGEYAVTGYNGDACPVIGMYHNYPFYDPTRDCVKYSSRHDQMPSCGAPRCVYRPAWDSYNIWQGWDYGPGDYAIHSNVMGGRTVQISGWPAKTLNSGSEMVYVASLGDYYSGLSNRLWVDTYVYVEWVRINFNLTPTLTLSPSVSSGGSQVQLSPNVNNTALSGNTTTSDPAQWRITTFSLTPGTAVPNSGGGTNNIDPTPFFGGNAAPLAGGSGTRQFNAGNTPIPLPLQTIADLPVGSKVCYALSVQPISQTSSDWRHSPPACVTIAKSPKVQVRAGDLQVGRGASPSETRVSNIITSVTSKGGLFYGSWSEYGIIPTGVVTGMASGSGYVGGATTADLCNLSILTFTVGGSGGGCGVIGEYTQTAVAPNVSTRFPINVPAASASPSLPASPAVLPATTFNIIGNNLSGAYQAPAGATALTVTGGASIPKGRWVAINAPNATVTITGNITYTNDDLASLSDVPQVIIIAKNIIIQDNVTNIDAWLIAVGKDVVGTPSNCATAISNCEGRVNTCGADSAAPLTITETNNLVYTECDKPLTVNGPVFANHLIMRRTAGSGVGAQSGDPAETFNLRPDAYIWGTYYNIGTGRLSTITNKELPPRF